jgi:TP53 regulating kinase-like protein
LQRELVKKGAEADIYLTEWAGKKAVAKVRSPKPYRHQTLDASIRKQRTVHEANFLSAAKAAGVAAPFVYFVDPAQAEIIMEYVPGTSAKDSLTPKVCHDIGMYAAMLHAGNIIHGDLATSNFIVGEKLVLLDFGLAYYSERMEDMATDIRLIKEVFSSAHISEKNTFPSFVKGYASMAGKKRTEKILENVKEIEQRGRYARVA